MKLDILAFGAHPDDVELSCSGTLMKMAAKGYKTGVIDLTRGELGTRGNAELREKEAADAAVIMGLSARENLGLPDGFFDKSEGNLRAVIRMIRKYRPEIVLMNAPYDRHPDHGKGAELVKEGAFLAGLMKISTEEGGKAQAAWRPRNMYHYIQDQWIMPTFVVGISGFMDQKIEAIKAYSSQFHNPESNEPETYISSSHFFEHIIARCKETGHMAGEDYGEGFVAVKTPGVNDLMDLF